ncbi:15466_t:CDS:2 [Acaulospora colombiana]|uniref:15466_t:CDS:1 n=1 Tax=Acaulospora colombiana TaxID=27376 RepID=A0ACA9MNF7_9GLOM|nr:15466_t:CDS:2 [Acaulospora colombiana]
MLLLATLDDTDTENLDQCDFAPFGCLVWIFSQSYSLSPVDILSLSSPPGAKYDSTSQDFGAIRLHLRIEVKKRKRETRGKRKGVRLGEYPDEAPKWSKVALIEAKRRNGKLIKRFPAETALEKRAENETYKVQEREMRRVRLNWTRDEPLSMRKACDSSSMLLAVEQSPFSAPVAPSLLVRFYSVLDYYERLCLVRTCLPPHFWHPSPPLLAYSQFSQGRHHTSPQALSRTHSTKASFHSILRHTSPEQSQIPFNRIPKAPKVRDNFRHTGDGQCPFRRLPQADTRVVKRPSHQKRLAHSSSLAPPFITHSHVSLSPFEAYAVAKYRFRFHVGIRIPNYTQHMGISGLNLDPYSSSVQPAAVPDFQPPLSTASRPTCTVQRQISFSLLQGRSYDTHEREVQRGKAENPKANQAYGLLVTFAL